MKKCSKCEIEKNIYLFGNAKEGKNGLQSICKKCIKKAAAEYKRTKKGLINTMYHSQKGNSKRRGHQPPTYTFNEFSEWLTSQTLFHELYSIWKASGYKRRLIPSVDRKYDDIHYCMSNIQLMTAGENHKKQINGLSRPVLQMTTGREPIAEYASLREMQMITGFSKTNVRDSCIEGRKAKGYLWSFA